MPDATVKSPPELLFEEDETEEVVAKNSERVTVRPLDNTVTEENAEQLISMIQEIG